MPALETLATPCAMAMSFPLEPRPVRRLAGVMMLVAFLGACTGDDNPSDSPTTSGRTVTTAAPKPGCLTVNRIFLSRLEVFPASAVKETVPAKEGGLAEKGEVWFVSTKAGETWVTSADPTADNAEGMVLPLNDKARKVSPVGAEVPAGDPAFEGLSDDSAGAARSRSCAGAE